jgi:hypothetical protein
MKLIQLLASSVVLLSAFVGAEDVLHSRRNLGKRFIDEQGNYNICECGHE